MDFANISTRIDPFRTALNAVSERQRLTSSNIANAHTPGYTAREVSFSDLLKTDSPFETALSQRMGSKFTEMNNNTGMPVDLQKELIEMQKNNLMYMMVTKVTGTYFSNLKTATQVGR